MAVNTGYTAFERYCEALNNAGYTSGGITGSSTTSIAHARYLAADGTHTVYVYIINAMKEVRMVVDTQADMVGAYANGFVYESTTGETAQPMLVMWCIGGGLIYLAIAKKMEPTLLLPMSSVLERIAYLVVPEGKETARAVELDERLLATPSIALGQCHNLTLKMAEETAEGFRMSLDAFRRSDWDGAARVEPLEQVIDHLKANLRNRHISRLKKGECSVEAGFIWSDLLTNLERASDHCSNIAVSIIDAHAHNMNAHQRLRSMTEGNPVFFERLDDFSRKYRLPQE